MDFPPSPLDGLVPPGALRVVYQPLIDLASGRIFAYEALVRCDAPNLQRPPDLFEAAIQHGCCGLLGRRIRELAVHHCPYSALFLNIHPHEFSEGWLVRPDDPIFSHDYPIWLEITESVPLSHFSLCTGVLREVRHKGIKLAVDDLGAGYSNLKYIAELSPEVVKLDRKLIINLNSESRLRTLVKHIVALCAELGARVVAEGIEQAQELAAVTLSGVDFAQGYHLARPSFPPPHVRVWS